MKKLISAIFLCFSITFLGACTANQTQTTVPQATEVAVAQATVTVVLPTETPLPPDQCIACHTDKQKLIDTAMAEEEDAHGSESEGVG